MPVDDPASDEPARAVVPTVLGARWAVILGAALLVALALVTAVRWLGKPAVSFEQIVQVPVPVVTPTPPPPPEVFAPDPGDTP